MIKDKGILKAIWAGLFLLCSVLGFLPEQSGANRVLLVIFAVAFFAPPARLIWVSYREKDLGQLRLVRNLSLLSLGGTMVLILCNLLSVLGSENLGDGLYYLLAFWSTPMFCGHYWVLSLLLWALLLWGSIFALGKCKKAT